MKVLIADDHALVRAGLRAQLLQLDPKAEVLEAGDWTATLATAADPSLDLALVDLRMPGGKAEQSLTQLLRECPGLPVVVVSASDDPSDMRTALSNGAMGYLTKSEPTSVVLAALRLVLEGGVYVPPALAGVKPRVEVATAAVPELTERQRDVLRWVIEGKSNQEIAILLEVSRATVKMHLAAIFRALDVTNRTQAAVVAQRLGL